MTDICKWVPVCTKSYFTHQLHLQYNEIFTLTKYLFIDNTWEYHHRSDGSTIHVTIATDIVCTKYCIIINGESNCWMQISWQRDKVSVMKDWLKLSYTSAYWAYEGILGINPGCWILVASQVKLQHNTLGTILYILKVH